tara:strand:- start:64 stop:240 length:177 start_codon:yes stop_codon:yes gene_type:complete
MNEEEEKGALEVISTLKTRLALKEEIIEDISVLHQKEVRKLQARILHLERELGLKAPT